jgi:hypothetical protein
MPKPRVIDENYEQGRVLYCQGGSLRDLMENIEDLQERLDAAATPDSDLYDKRQNAAPSIVLGYADAALADLKKLIGGGGGAVRGGRA